jgi:uncharacterized protein
MSQPRTNRPLKDRLRHNAGLLGMAVVAIAVGVTLAVPLPAQAQFWFPFGGQPRRPPGSVPQQQYNQQYNPFGGGFFGGEEPRREAPVDYSHAPSPPSRHSDVAPTTSIVVLGDAMADWLAYGLEDAYSDRPEIAIVRKPRAGSGLIRYDNRRDAADWAQTAREIIASEKPKFVVMMIGANDHQTIRERAPTGRPANQTPAKPGAAQTPAKPGAAQVPPPTPDAAALAAEEAPPDQSDEGTNPAADTARSAGPSGPFEFHSPEWEAAYIKRIDGTIAAMKSGGTPVIWVGLPAQRGPRATSDASYLNDLYRSRAERAGIIYVDIWDGFVDEQGRYSPSGPDFEGQIRRLRSGDGVYFTKAGARKLAHYAEREIDRAISDRAIPVALPSNVDVSPPGTRPGPNTRPLAGPVIPLTVSNSGGDELLGGARPPARPVSADPLAARALTRGEAIPAPSGRADDFSWPRGSGNAATLVVEPAAPASATASRTVPNPPPAAAAPPAAKPPTTTGKPAANAAGATALRADPDAAADDKPKPAPKRVTPPTPQPFNPFGGIFR